MDISTIQAELDRLKEQKAQFLRQADLQMAAYSGAEQALQNLLKMAETPEEPPIAAQCLAQAIERHDATKRIMSGAPGQGNGSATTEETPCTAQ